MLQEAEAASEAPAEDDSLGDGDDWGSDDGDDGWGDDDDDWKRKKRSVEESPSERWTRETHEVDIMHWVGPKDPECFHQRVVNFQEPAVDLPSADLRTMDHDANTFEKVVLHYGASSTTPYTNGTMVAITGWLSGLQVQLGSVQRQERDAAEAEENPPRHGRPVQEGLGGGV